MFGTTGRIKNRPRNIMAVVVLAAIAGGCQGSDRVLQVADNINATVSGDRFDPTKKEVAPDPPSPERAAEIAEIRQKAAAKVDEQGEFPKIFDVQDSVATELDPQVEEERIANSVGTASSPAAEYANSVLTFDSRADELRKKAETHFTEAESDILRIRAQQEADRLKAEAEAAQGATGTDLEGRDSDEPGPATPTD